MFAKMIYNGATAKSLEMSEVEYNSRVSTLQEFLRTWNGVDFEEAYLLWLREKNGITTIVDKPNVDNTPTTKEMVSSFAVAAAQHVKSGFKKAEPEEIERRKKLCSECDKMGTSGRWEGRCMVCGCFMGVKAKWATAKCPVNKW